MTDQRPLRVLLVEDNPADAMLAKEFFKETSLQVIVTTVRDGEKAIEVMDKVGKKEAEKPDLILLDLNLPKRSGHEVLEFIRRSAEISDLCVAIYTGSHSPDDTRRAELNKVNAYLIKPIGPREMDETIRTLREILIAVMDSSYPTAS